MDLMDYHIMSSSIHLANIGREGQGLHEKKPPPGLARGFPSRAPSAPPPFSTCYFNDLMTKLQLNEKARDQHTRRRGTTTTTRRQARHHLRPSKSTHHRAIARHYRDTGPFSVRGVHQTWQPGLRGFVKGKGAARKWTVWIQGPMDVEIFQPTTTD
ncbi:hypothetical protein CDEST_02921 [Colletotrichum destructivum]|uniref:Uncharacterized protein n=1 Tax=Colletotrichum destructivum TaxID=34406 RepID=A0AAX4I3D9_9PEZI|nr:hypothetical protein CDEST_02921 [Colletotrichum destructivum]